MNIFKKFSHKIDSLPGERKPLAGLILVLTSAIFFAFSNLLVKGATKEYSSFTVVFWRGWVGLIIILSLARFRFRELMGINKRALLSRGFVGTVALLFFFSAIKYTTLSNSIGIFNTYPVFTALLGSLFFKERWRKIYLFALGLSLIGIWLIIRPEIGFIGKGEGLALAAAFFAAWVINLIRHLRKTDSVYPIVFYFLVFVCILSPVPAGTGELVLSFNGWFVLGLIAILTTCAQLLMTTGYKYCTATGGSIVSLLGLPITLMLSRVFLGERLDLYLILGAFLVFMSGYLVAFSKRKRLE